MNRSHEDSTQLVSLVGRVAMVVGGAGGIGSAVVSRFVEAGATVVAVDQASATPPLGATCLPCDITDADAVAALFNGFEKRFARLDILVHAAGITRDAMLWKMPSADWTQVLRVNLESAFHILQGAAPIMRRAGSGSVILITSINGERGKVGQSNYAASKAGLIGLGRTAARELGPSGVRVNMIAPGLIRTAMTQNLPEPVLARAQAESALGRLGEPDDVARVALFLAADLSRHVTGQVIRVDGGQLIG
ncbi:MAG TPA: SDR family NAD(P)-dependent oxidoreductase [Candidatus Krumholzibacteria bacterium]|nr:SDR family NAD(P)-dependent oxidoreductase [Candidatus Krumholzibacteria bacterium]